MYTMLTVMTVTTTLLSANLTETNTRMENLQECKTFVELRKDSANRKGDKVQVNDDGIIVRRELGFLSEWASVYVCAEVK